MLMLDLIKAYWGEHGLVDSVTSSVLSFPLSVLSGHPSGRHFFGRNSPAAIAREVFKPSTDAASLLVSIKKIFRFGFGVLLGGRHKMGLFLNFWPTLTGSGRLSNKPLFWLKIVLETTMYDYIVLAT